MLRDILPFGYIVTPFWIESFFEILWVVFLFCFFKNIFSFYIIVNVKYIFLIGEDPEQRCFLES